MKPKIYVFSLTKRGEALSQKVAELLDDVQCMNAEQIKEAGGIFKVVETVFKTAKCLIFIGASGIAVRSIAPHLIHKFEDPAVLVIDEKGQYVISLLAGHVGGANTYAKMIAEGIQGTPVITTATDVNGLGALDLILKTCHCDLPKHRLDILKINKAMLEGESVDLYFGKGVDEAQLRKLTLEGFQRIEAFESWKTSESPWKIYIGTSCIEIEQAKEQVPSETCIIGIPKCFVLGTGSKKNLDYERYETSFEAFLEKEDLVPEAISRLVSVDIKKEEPCMRKLAEAHGYELKFYSIKEIETVNDRFEKSEQVYKTLGIHQVAAPVVYLETGGQEEIHYFKGMGCTFALGRYIL